MSIHVMKYLFCVALIPCAVSARASCCTCGYTEFQVVDPIKAPNLQVSKFCNTAAGYMSVVQFRNVGKPAISFVWSGALDKKKSEKLGPGLWTGKKEVVSQWVGPCGCNGPNPVFDINIESVDIKEDSASTRDRLISPANIGRRQEQPDR